MARLVKQALRGNLVQNARQFRDYDPKSVVCFEETGSSGGARPSATTLVWGR